MSPVKVTLSFGHVSYNMYRCSIKIEVKWQPARAATSILYTHNLLISQILSTFAPAYSVIHYQSINFFFRALTCEVQSPSLRNQVF